MTLAMMFLRSSVDMVKVHTKDLDCVETRAIGWTLSLLATIATEIEIADFVAMIASLNIVAKTFVKILSAMIIATRR